MAGPGPINGIATVILVDSTGTPISSLGGGGTSGGTANALSPNYVEAATAQAISLDLHGAQRMLVMDHNGAYLDYATPALTNQTQINSVAVLAGNGVAGTGAQRVTIASDNTAFTVNAAQSGTWTINGTSGTPILKSALTNSASAVVSSAAAVLSSYYIWNPNASVAYVQIYDIATAGGVTVGTTVPKWSIGIPPTSAANIAGLNLAFAAGIQVAATTTAGGSTAPGTALDCNFGYR